MQVPNFRESLETPRLRTVFGELLSSLLSHELLSLWLLELLLEFTVSKSRVSGTHLEDLFSQLIFTLEDRLLSKSINALLTKSGEETVPTLMLDL